MQTQTLINKDTVPPGGFRFLCSETGVWISAPSFDELLKGVKKHYLANSIPVPLLFAQEIETQLCSTLPPGVCTYASETDRKRAAAISRPTWRKVLDLTGYVFEQFKDDPHVSQDEARKRSLRCCKCQFNQQPDGCSSCNSGQRAQLVGALLGTNNKHLPGEDKLQSCLICGCELRVKIWHKIETVQAQAKKHDYYDALPDHCWVREESGAPDQSVRG